MNPFYYDPDNPHRPTSSTSPDYNNQHLESTQISASSANSSFPYPTPNVSYGSSLYSHSVPSDHYSPQLDSQRQHHLPPQAHSEAIYHPNTFLHYNELSSNYDQSSSLLHFDQPPRIASPQPLYSPPLPDPSPRTRRSSLPIPPPLPSFPSFDNYDSTSSRHRGKRTRREPSIKLEDQEEAPTPVSHSARSLPNPSTSETPLNDTNPPVATSVSLGEESTVVEKAEKSCKACRGRKVRCSRTWPKCSRCVEKGLECFYGHLVPLSFLKSDPRIQELEEKIRLLEASARDDTTTISAQRPPRFTSGFPHLPSSSDFTTSITSSIINRILVDVPCKKQLAAHVNLVEEQVRNRSREGGRTGRSVSDAFVGDFEKLENLQTLSLEDRVRTKDWARFVALGLLDAFWATCASCLPTFRPLLARRSFLYEAIDHLNARDRVVVALFCATGARSTNDLALLGLGEVRRGSSNELGSSIAQAREDICMSIRSCAMGLYDQLEVAFEGATKEGLAVHTASALIMLWNELLPKRSRGLLRTGLSMYRDLYDAAGSEATRLELMKEFGLPLLNLDSTLAAYSRSSPLVSDCELDLYFSIHSLPSPIARLDPSCRAHKQSDDRTEPNWALPSLAADLSPLLDINQIQQPTHLELREASLVIYSWVIACFRWIAERSCPKGLGQPLAPSSLDGIFSLVSQVHAAISNLKRYLIQLTSPYPHSTCLPPSADGCIKPDLHLRYLCRLNRKVDDTIWLTHSMVRDRLAESQRGGDHDATRETISDEWLRLTESKIVEGLKLSAFYFRVYAMSPIPHEVHHLAWSLETLPDWPQIAVEHHSRAEVSNNNQLGLEMHEVTPSLSEQELDYIEAGLDTTYHPVVVKRLQELRELRLERNGGGGKASRMKRRPLTATKLTFREAVLQASSELDCI